MTVYTPTADPTALAELRADLDQLRLAIVVPVRQRSRRTGTRWTAITHPGLLDQLRQAAAGQNRTARGPERRQTPRSRPHEPDGSPDLTAPAGEIPHQPDPVDVVPFTTDGSEQPARARCVTCKGGQLVWRDGGWKHVDAAFAAVVENVEDGVGERPIFHGSATTT